MMSRFFCVVGLVMGMWVAIPAFASRACPTGSIKTGTIDLYCISKPAVSNFSAGVCTCTVRQVLAETCKEGTPTSTMNCEARGHSWTTEPVMNAIECGQKCAQPGGANSGDIETTECCKAIAPSAIQGTREDGTGSRSGDLPNGATPGTSSGGNTRNKRDR